MKSISLSQAQALFMEELVSDRLEILEEELTGYLTDKTTQEDIDKTNELIEFFGGMGRLKLPSKEEEEKEICAIRNKIRECKKLIALLKK